MSSDKKAKMAPQPSAPPGLEQDNRGNAIPFEQRTEDDQELARGQNHHKAGTKTSPT